MRLLTELETHSAIWEKIDTYLTTRLAEQYRKLAGDLDEVSTAKLRGRIKELEFARFTLATDLDPDPAKLAENGEPE